MYHSFFPWLVILIGMLALLPWLYRWGNKGKPRLTVVRSRDF